MNSRKLPESKSAKPKRQELNIRLPPAGLVITANPTGNSESLEDMSSIVGASKSQENSEIFSEDSESCKKIKDLVNKTSEMKDDLKQKDEIMEEKFTELRKRINSSVAFLRSTKNQIENIKFLYQKDMLNMAKEQNFGDCLQSSDQNIQELNRQMEEIQRKLTAVKERAKQAKEARNQMYKNENFDTTISETVNALESIGRGNYGENNGE